MTHTVVIADDEPSVRMLVQATIEADGYNVLEASDGDEAWVLIQEHRPSLVLLDVMMPGRTGLEILGSIKSDPDLVDTKVILLTASAQKCRRRSEWQSRCSPPPSPGSAASCEGWPVRW